jgi:hypothetical protein
MFLEFPGQMAKSKKYFVKNGAQQLRSNLEEPPWILISACSSSNFKKGNLGQEPQVCKLMLQCWYMNKQ